MRGTTGEIQYRNSRYFIPFLTLMLKEQFKTKQSSEGQAATSSAISIENTQLQALQTAFMLQLGVLLRPFHRLGNWGHRPTSLLNCSEISVCRDRHAHEVQPLYWYRLFTAFAWTFCAQQGGAFAATAPLWACSNAVLPFKAWPHQIPQYRSPTCIQDRRERQAGHIFATRMWVLD